MLISRVVSSAPSTVATLPLHRTHSLKLQSNPSRAKGQDHQDQKSVGGSKRLVFSRLSSFYFWARRTKLRATGAAVGEGLDLFGVWAEQGCQYLLYGQQGCGSGFKASLTGSPVVFVVRAKWKQRGIVHPCAHKAARATTFSN